MTRRDFIALLGLGATWPLMARAQQLPVIGFLHAASAGGYASEVAAFRQGLRETGYIEGQNVAIDYRWADGHYDRLPGLAADLVRQHVAVIVAAPIPTALAAKHATDAIPIVFELGIDPVKLGLVESLNRPGGNITGIVNLAGSLVPKRIELLHEIAPGAGTIAVLLNADNQNLQAQIDDARTAENRLGVKVQILQARTIDDIDASFGKVRDLKTGALVIGPDPYFNTQLNQMAALAMRYGVPVSAELRGFAAAGGLMSYGSDLNDAYRLTGTYAGRVLKGEKPADLPVQRATKVNLVINLKAAKALGLTVPLTLLGRVDEVIE